MKVRILLVLVIFMHVLHAEAQSTKQKRDSLFQLAQTTQNDSLKVDAINQVVGFMTRTDADSAVSLAKENILLAKKIGFLRGEASAYNRMGISQRNLGNYEEAEKSNQEALRLFLQTTDSLGMANAYESLGNVYRHIGKYVESLDCQIKCMGIRERNKAPAKEIAKAYTHIANVHMSMEQFDDALKYYKKSLDLWKKENNQEQLAISTLNYGAVLFSIKRLEESQMHLERSLQIFDSLELRYGIGAAYANLGDVFMEKKQLKEARTALNEALDIYQSAGDKGRTAMFLSNLGEIEVMDNNYPLAINYYEQALDLANQIGRPTTLKDTYERLSFLYEKTGQFEEAYFSNKSLMEVKDSMLNTSTLEKIQELQTQYETEKKDQEIEFLKKNEERRVKERNFLILGLGILFVLSLVTLRAFRTASNANRKLSAEQEQTKALLQEKEELLEKLQFTHEKLIQSEKMASLGQFVAGVAHEINNPISFINTNIYALKMDFEEVHGLLEKVGELKNTDDMDRSIQEVIKMSERMDTSYLNTEIQQMVDGIERGISRTKNIINSLLTFSHHSKEGFEKADLNQGLEHTLTIIKGNLDGKTIIHKDLGEIPKIDCHISRIQQVFLNVLNNSLQAIEESGNIYIKSWQENDQVKISIRDDGKGMDQTTQQRIFEPFFTTKKLGQGTGLGMAISYGIIEQHNGELELDSTLGEGTEVLISLPIEINE